MDIEETQHCKRCKRDLPKEDFHNNRKYWKQCNICRAKKLASRKIWREGAGKEWLEKYKESYKEKHRENVRNFRERNPDKGKEYYAKNRETILAKDKIYRENNKEKNAARKKKWVLENKDKHKCPKCDYTSPYPKGIRHHLQSHDNLNCSKGEFKIMQTLDEMGIEYKFDRSYKLNNLRWDFILEIDSNTLFIEYDGVQHFKPTRFGGVSQEMAEDKLVKQQAHDKLKDEFCKEEGHHLLRIPYTQFGNIPQLVTEFITTNTAWSG